MSGEHSDYIDDLRASSDLGAGEPYQPAPPDEAEPSQSPGDSEEMLFREEDVDQEKIGGLSIGFGTQQIKEIDGHNNARHIRQFMGHILGSGRLVSGLKPRSENGINLPGVGGACFFCKQESLELLLVNQLSLDEAERRSLFDTDSGSQCEACGRKDICIRHCQPFEVQQDGKMTVARLCPDCIRKAQKQRWFNTALSILLSPLIEHNQLPPAEKDERTENDS